LKLVALMPRTGLSPPLRVLMHLKLAMNSHLNQRQLTAPVRWCHHP
jgi:hypothetical protein